MNLQLYVKTNIIGLCFTNQGDRDTFWTLLGEHQNCAERFGNRTIRFNPAKATTSFRIALDAEVKGVFVDKEVGTVPMPPTPPAMIQERVVPVEAPVIPSAPAPIEPIAIIPAEPSIVAASVIELPTPIRQPPVSQPPPATIEMPQIGSVDALGVLATVAKPPDLRSRAGRAWKAQQQHAAVK